MKPLKKLALAAAAASAAGFGMAAAPATAQECMLGEVKMFAGNFAPRGWAFADGQLLAINNNSALFSLLGTTYGGDGRTTFALPDLRGRAPIGARRGPGLSDRQLGQRLGTENSQTPNVNIKTAPGSDPVEVGGTVTNNMQPSLAINYIVCLQGIYPSRS